MMYMYIQLCTHSQKTRYDRTPVALHGGLEQGPWLKRPQPFPRETNWTLPPKHLNCQDVYKTANPQSFFTRLGNGPESCNNLNNLDSAALAALRNPWLPSSWMASFGLYSGMETCEPLSGDGHLPWFRKHIFVSVKNHRPGWRFR